MLFVLKKAQVELQRIWTIHKQVKKTMSEYSPMLPFWLLRKSMSFLIDSLQYYFQVRLSEIHLNEQFGVLETQYSIMCKKIVASADFETIKKAHEDFLTISLSQCFVSNRMMLRCFHEIFKICFNFCAAASREDLPQNLASLEPISKVFLHILHTDYKQFDKQSSILFTFLQQVQNKQHQLEQLLFQLNVQKSSIT